MSGAAYEWLAAAVVAAHLLFILWVIFGALATRGRPWLAGAHIGCLLYGIFIEIAPWPCPLTLLENALARRGGGAGYEGSFLLHYLRLVVYPNLSDGVLIAGAVVVCAFNLGVYWRRHTLRKRAATTAPHPRTKATHGTP